MSDQDLLTTIKFTVDGSGVESGLTSVKRSIKDLGDAVKSISDKTNDALGKVGTTDLPVAKGLTKASKDIIKQTGDIEKAIATFGSAASTSLRSAYKSIEAEEVRMRGMGIDPAIMNPYLEKLKEVQKLSAAVANQDRKIAAEQAAAQQKIFDTEAHYAALKVQHAAHNKSIADQEIASTKARADALKAYYTEAQNAELNLIHTGRGKSSAMLTDKGQRLGFTDAEINTAVSGLKKVEEANKTAFAAANPHLEKLRAQAEASNTSVKGLTASLRNVPAQFTDIIVSLQGGQAPLTVLLQQGGQLKDMFGGVGNAAKALGGYVLGLVNPFTLTAGAVAVLGYAYLKGTAEGEAYNKALITTGNYAGTTALQLAGMAKSVSSATGGTIGAAADALAQLSGNGNIAASQFEMIAGAALKMEKTTGTSVAETVKQFAELGKDPLISSIKLNDATNYLTESVYKQIKALAEHGDTVGAASVAQKAFADSINERTPVLIENIGSLEFAWKMVGKAIKDAGDFMAGIGRPEESDSIRIAKRISELEQLSAPGRGMFAGRSQAEENELTDLRMKADYWAGIEKKNAAVAESQSKAAIATKARAEWEKDVAQNLSKQQKMALEISDASGKFGRLQNKTPDDNAAYARQIANIQDKYKETAKAAAKIPADAWDKSVLEAYTKAMDSMDVVQLRAAASAESLSKTQAALRAVQSGPQWEKFSRQQQEQVIYAASLAQAEEDLTATKKDAVKADQDSYKAMHDLQKQAEADYKTSAKAAREYILTAQEYADVVAMEANLVGLNAEQRKLAIEQYKIEADWKKEIARIDGMSNQSDAQKAELKAQYSAAKIIKLNASTTKSFQDQWMSTFDTIRDGLTDAFISAIDGTKSLWVALRDSVESMFKNMVLKPIIQGVMAPVATALTGSLIGTAANAATGASATSGLIGAGGVAGIGTQFGAGMSLAMQNGFISGFGANMASLSAAVETGMYSTAAGIALPYVGAPLAGIEVLKNLGVFGSNFTSSSTIGVARNDYASDGSLASSALSGNTSEFGKSLDALAKSYFDTASSLGIKAITAAFEVGGNTGKEGTAPQTVLGVNAGTGSYSSGEIAAGDTAALQLAASRAILTALQASELPGYLSGVFTSITASTATQDQITATLQYAQSLKTVRDALLETRTPLQILQDTVATGFTSLGTSAETFKTDFVAAIDGGLSADNLAKWQGLQSSMTSLAATAATVSDTMRSLTQANANLSDQWDKLTLSQDAYRAKTIAGYTEQEQAQARANYAIEDSIAAYNAQATTNQQAADAAATLAAQVIADAQASAAAILSERQGLQDQYDTLTMTSAQLLDKQRNALDASNQALFDQVQSATDAKKAADDLAAAQTALAAAQTALAATNKTLQNQLDVLTGAQTERGIALRDATDDSTRALMKQVYVQQDLKTATTDYLATAKVGATDAMSALTRSVDAQKKSIQLTITAAQEQVTATKGVFDAASAAVKELYGSVGSTAQMQADQGRAFISQALATAQTTGYLPDTQQLSDAIAAAKGNSQEFASQVDADFAKLALAGDLSQLEALSKGQLTSAELALKAAEDQVTALDDILSTAQAQLDAANGLNTVMLSVADALTAFTSSLSTLNRASSASGGSAGSAATQVAKATQSYYADTIGTIANTSSFSADNKAQWYKSMVSTGFTDDAIRTMVEAAVGPQTQQDWAYLKTLASYDVGTNFVPTTGPYTLHEGEAVIPRAYNPAAGGMGNSRTDALLEGLTKEVQRLQAIVNDGNKHQERSADMLQNVTEGGNAMRSIVMEPIPA